MLHQMLLSRLIAAASALIFSVLSFVAPPQRIANEGTVVRVGLCFGETAKRSVTVRASGGFTLGRAEEDGWTALLTTECETIVVSRRIARPVTGESRYKNASAAAEAAAQSGGTVLYENGAYAVAEGLSPADAEPLFVVADESGKPLFLYAGEEALTLAAGAAIEFPADETLYSYRGRIECIPDGTRFSVVNTVGLEDYVKGVLPWEIGANESDETTKAFAVLTRTAPLSGRSLPASTRSSVDLPVPLGPAMTSRSPRSTFRSNPLTRRLPPAETQSFLVVSTSSYGSRSYSKRNFSSYPARWGRSVISIFSSCRRRLWAILVVLARTRFLST